MKGWIFVFLIIVILFFLSYTNPSEEDFVIYLKEYAKLEAGSSSSIGGKFLGRLLAEVVSLDARINVRTQDYFIFSIFTYVSDIPQVGEKKIIGIANHFYFIK